MIKLNNDNPFKKKVDELMQIAEEMGIKIEYNNYYTIITDVHNNKEYHMCDLDSGEQSKEFPTFAEFKLIYEKIKSIWQIESN